MGRDSLEQLKPASKDIKIFGYKTANDMYAAAA